MQVPKAEIKRSIIVAAREEFLKNGFEKASIRVKTSKAKTSKSNVYNYFKDKESLFYAVVEPTILEVEEGFRQLRSKNKNANPFTMEAKKEVTEHFVEFAFTRCEDIRV